MSPPRAPLPTLLACGLSLLILTLPVMAEEKAGSESKPKVLKVKTDLPASFRDAALERRCGALVGWFVAFADQYLKPLKLEIFSCSEGNGLGGARYTVDIRTQEKLVAGSEKVVADWLSYRIDIGLVNGEPRVVLCDTASSPIACMTNKAEDPLTFASGNGRFETPKEAELAAGRFRSLHANMPHLLPSLSAWVTQKPVRHVIYGMDYRDFVKKILDYEKGFPFVKAEKVASVQFDLVPDDPKNPVAGKVKFAKKVDPDFLACFKCASSECLNGQIRYRFEDRFFSLTRVLSPEESKKAKYLDANYGAGWIIEGPDPQAASGEGWKFVCGVSRYSLQNVEL